MRVAIANRGEVAVRIIRTCQELGFTPVLLHSTPDKNTLAYRIADETYELSGETSNETYLNISTVIDAAVKAKCDLLHPGFGFLSENSEFVAALEKTKVKFVGPPSNVIKLVGNKIAAKKLAQDAGVPVNPALIDLPTDPKKLLQEVRKIGFPCLVKAASGGGGKGMKLVQNDTEFFELFDSAKREAQKAFGSSEVFIEKYISKPRHIEVQILCDSHDKRLHFFERECSIQRRHQKIFEETPSFAIEDKTKKKVFESALKIAEAADYINAGTVEFLVDENQDFYFMELNTRLQVEHTVTEQVCGVDFVRHQFEIALGGKLSISQDELAQRGHALEVRIYAENPAQEFLPSTGKIELLNLPYGPHRRFDFGYETGDAVTPHYDPMIGKIITWAPTREENINRMHATLCETVIFGVHTNIEFLKDVLSKKKFQENDLSTDFLEKEYKEGFKNKELSQSQKAFIEEVSLKPQAATQTQTQMRQSPWVHKWN